MGKGVCHQTGKIIPGNKLTPFPVIGIGYAENTILTAESEEELKSLLMEVKEEREKLA